MGSPGPTPLTYNLVCRVSILGTLAEQTASADAIETEKSLCLSQGPPGSALLGSTTSPYKRQNLEFHGCTNASLTLDWAQYLRSSQLQLQPTAACAASGSPHPRPSPVTSSLLSPSRMRCSSLLAALVTEDHSWGWYQCSSFTIGRDGVDSGSSG